MEKKLSLHNNFHDLPAEGEKIDFNTAVYLLNDDLSLSKLSLTDFIDKHKEITNTPFGIQDKYFTEGSQIKHWFFGKDLPIHEYDSVKDAENALKVFHLHSINASDTAPLFFYSIDEAEKAITEMYTEEEISERLELER